MNSTLTAIRDYLILFISKQQMMDLAVVPGQRHMHPMFAAMGEHRAPLQLCVLTEIIADCNRDDGWR
jgi:hypothetical protein